MLRDVLGGGDLRIGGTGECWRQVKGSGLPSETPAQQHQPLLKACPEMLSQFAGVGVGGRGGWVATLEPESTHLGLLRAKLSRNSLNAFGRQLGQ